MKKQKNLAKTNSLRGFTLIEIMVAMVLGLVVIGGMYNLFVVSKQMVRYQSNIGPAQEKAIFALEVMAEDIRLSGWPGVFDPSGTDPFGNRFNGSYPLFNDTGSQYDTLVVSRRGRTADPGNPDPLLQKNEMDCVGNEIDFNVQNEPLTHIYYVDPNTRELMCKSTISNKSAPIIDNVVGFQVLYGVDMVAGPCPTPLPGISAKDALAECMTPTRFVRGDQLDATLQQAMLNQGADSYTQLIPIKAIRLAIVVQTEEGNLIKSTRSESEQFDLFGENFANGIDGLDFSEGKVNRFAIRTIALREALRGP